MIACCLAGPLLVGALGAVAVGSVLGVACGALVLLGACVLLARRLRSGGRC
jgi:hypothetical protein